MPRDGLALAVGIGRQKDHVRPARQGADAGDSFLAAWERPALHLGRRDVFVLQGEVGRFQADVVLRQVADMAEGGDDLPAVAEDGFDFLHLIGAFHDHELHRVPPQKTMAERAGCAGCSPWLAFASSLVTGRSAAADAPVTTGLSCAGASLARRSSTGAWSAGGPSLAPWAVTFTGPEPAAVTRCGRAAPGAIDGTTGIGFASTLACAKTFCTYDGSPALSGRKPRVKLPE
ncbi:hypothetical protein SDC9_171334 [bioreactor metagenome]|uniref:Uncharacterized protein n=1 Tax=bioreactor metagenome TaxID=1076179 RepID=A0A645GAL4_9ZZZZ